MIFKKKVLPALLLNLKVIRRFLFNSVHVLKYLQNAYKVYTKMKNVKNLAASKEDNDNIFHILDKQTFVPTLLSNFFHKTICKQPKCKNINSNQQKLLFPIFYIFLY